MSRSSLGPVPKQHIGPWQAYVIRLSRQQGEHDTASLQALTRCSAGRGIESDIGQWLSKIEEAFLGHSAGSGDSLDVRWRESSSPASSCFELQRLVSFPPKSSAICSFPGRWCILLATEAI